MFYRKSAIFALSCLIPESYSLTRQSDGRFQIIKSDGTTSTCLTLKTDSGFVSLATNPATGLADFYPYAKYEPCDPSDPEQWFTQTNLNQLEANNQCLTALPNDAFTHPGLTGCENWSGYTGAGTYLYTTNCSTVYAQNQGFVLDPKVSNMQSECAHGLHIGVTATDRAFLTGNADTFPTASRLEDLFNRFQIQKNFPGETECLCLTVTSDTYLAINPDTSVQDFFPTAQWSECTGSASSNPDQWFKYDQFGYGNSLEANGMCLTSLAVDAFAHPSLDPCEPWDGYTGAGTYIFATGCDEMMSGYVQNKAWQHDWEIVFKAQNYSDVYRSECAHEMFIGKTGIVTPRAFLTMDVDTFPTAKIENHLLNNSCIMSEVDIRVPVNHAGFDLMSLMLNSTQLTDFMDHGCFCSKFTNDPLPHDDPNHGAPVADDLDQICKDWQQCRMCTSLKQGACHKAQNTLEPTYQITEVNETATHTQDFSDFDQHYSCNANVPVDDCLADCCSCDLFHSELVVDYLENTPSWQVQQSQNCDHITFQPGTTASTESSDRQRYERFCSGTAPDLTIMRQKI